MTGARERGALAAAGLGAGVLMAASLPPWGWWPLGPAGAAGLAFSLLGRPRWRRLLLGAAAGLGLYGPGLWWMTEFSAPGYVLTTLLEAGLLGLAMMAVPSGGGRRVAFPAALVLASAVGGHWPFGGLPLAGIALGQAGGLLASAARLGGHLLLVAMVGALGSALAALAHAVVGSDRRRWPGMRGVLVPLTAVAGVVVVAVAGAFAPVGSTRATLRVAAVQGGGQRGLRAIHVDPQVPLDAHLAASAGVGRPVDLVVFPENVVNVDGPLSGSMQEKAMADVARRLGATTVAGVVTDAGPDRFRNAAVAWATDGQVVATYEKVHRVPFGEYVPLRGVVGHLADLSAVPRDAIAGRGPGLLVTPAGPLGVMISYEVFFADRARAAVRAGAQVLLVPTNASSYTTSQVPAQELAAARLRAIETGRDVVQAAPTGFSAVINADGRVRRRSRLGPPDVVSATVTLRDGQTLAVRLGDGPLVLAAVVALVGACVWTRKRRLVSSPS
ncbi:MAG: apolipoprotein N-acyltransferase [Actinomycetota bacterium]|nr:apolipoprotein N-acyltransferase [Actinomycetota bacterium]